MSAEIFISYARADRDRVLPLVERLREAGVTYWLDEGNIQGATLCVKEIVEPSATPRYWCFSPPRPRSSQKCRQRGRYRL